MNKKTIIIALCVILALSLTLAGCGSATTNLFKDLITSAPEADNNGGNDDNNDDNKEPVVEKANLTMSEVYLPEGMDKEEFGLYWFSPETGWVSATADPNTIPFDDSKPIASFAHGMGSGGMVREEEAYAAGYNVAEFRWEQFADNNSSDTMVLQSRIWGVRDGIMGYVNNDDKEIFDDVPDHGIAWIYACYFNDFMKTRPNFSGSEIHFMGHSFGGQLTLAVTSCMIWGVETGRFSKEYLPDRVSMLDPYLAIADDPTVCEWLDQKLDNGAIDIGVQELKKIIDLGISTSLLRTSPYILAACSFWGGSSTEEMLADKAMFNEKYAGITALTLHTTGGTAFLEKQLGLVSGINERHVIAEYWFVTSLNRPILMDSASENSEEYGYNGRIPLSYAYARIGSTYSLNFNETEEVYSDDEITSTNINKAKIAGFAFNDENSNGVNDDRLYNRVGGVKVSLYKVGTSSPIQTTTTTKGGAYSFEVDDTNAEYYVKAEAPEGYTISGATYAEGVNAMDANNVNANGVSDTITFANNLSLRIVNISVK